MLASGTRIGAYQITAPLGAGGMGEVYRAHDARLGRDIAIKLLPEQFSKDADRLRRFELEARATGVLNHPNILAIYDVGTHEGSPYLVSELLEGETLRELLSNGQISSKRCIDYAAQISNGLAAAHAKGIVHRDLKPENLFITRDGRIKILDFGLAKLTQTSGENQSQLPTVASDPGVVLGTMGYMSPEQVRADAVDHRSDIFALGTIVYEMLSGKRAFHRGSVAETMSAILKEDPPDFDLKQSNTSPALERIIRRCVEKQPDRRFQSVSDLGFALETLSGPSTASSVAAQPEAARAAPRTSRYAWKAGVVAFVALALFVALRWHPGQSASEWNADWLGGPNYALGPRISPDGKLLAFQTVVDNQSQIGVMTPESGDWSIQTRDHRGVLSELCWSNDGARIFYDRFFEQPIGIFSVPARGNGEESLVLPDAWLPSVLADGSLIVTRLTSGVNQLYHFWPETQRLEPLAALPAASLTQGGAVRPIPGGHEIVFFGKPMGSPAALDHLYALDLTSNKTRRLAPEATLPQHNWNFPFVVTRDGEVLFDLPAGDLHHIVAAPVDGSAGLRSVLTLTEWPVEMDTGPDGSLYVDQFDEYEEIFRFSPSEQRLERFPLPHGNPGAYRYLISLPDGRVITPLLRSAGHDRLLVMTPGGDAKPLIQTQEETGGPVAMLGNDRLVFMQGTGPNRTVAIATLDGRPVRKMPHVPQDIQVLAGSPNGKTLFYVSAGEVWRISADTEDGVPQKIRPGVAIAVDPGGKYLLVESVEQRSNRLIRVPLAGGPEQSVTITGDTHPAVGNSLSPQAVDSDGRIAVRVVMKGLFTWPVAIIDPRSGIVKPLSGFDVDMISPGWDHSGRLITGAFSMRSSLWRFRPVKR